MQTDFQFFNPESEVIVTQGHLPHWDQAGATTFITWRTADSIPKHIWEQWRTARNQWLQDHCIDPSQQDWLRQVEMLLPADRQDFRRFSKQLENEIDRGHGACVLRDPSLSGTVADALRHFDGERYILGDFVIMPNHVHLLVGGMARATMLLQIASWKKWTAIQINKALGNKGRFWQDENYDHLVRDAVAFNRFRKYIAENPAKARLAEGAFHYWMRSDADGPC
jgi:putative transposase